MGAGGSAAVGIFGAIASIKSSDMKALQTQIEKFKQNVLTNLNEATSDKKGATDQSQQADSEWKEALRMLNEAQRIIANKV